MEVDHTELDEATVARSLGFSASFSISAAAA